MSGKKIVHVPIKIHILKHIKIHEKWDGDILDVRKSFYPKKGNPTTNTEKRYFENADGKEVIKVLMAPSSRAHQYAMVQFFEERFKKEMFSHIDVRLDIDKVYKPLRDFYAKYGIYPSEYDFDTAFKRYQREQNRRLKQKQQHEQNRPAHR